MKIATGYVAKRAWWKPGKRFEFVAVVNGKVICRQAVSTRAEGHHLRHSLEVIARGSGANA